MHEEPNYKRNNKKQVCRFSGQDTKPSCVDGCFRTTAITCVCAVSKGEGGTVMFWAGIVRDRMTGPDSVPKDVNITAITYCEFITDIISDWPGELPLSEVNKVAFMHDKAPARPTKMTQSCSPRWDSKETL